MSRLAVLPKDVCSTVERMMGRSIVAERPVLGGFTRAYRAIVSLSDGRSLFVKAASDDETHSSLEVERAVYSALQSGADFNPDQAELLGFRASAAGEWDEGGLDCPPFMPRLLGYSVSPQLRGVLLLEDLSHALRAPPWSARQIDSVLRHLDLLHKTPPTMWPKLPRLAQAESVTEAWTRLARDPGPAFASGVIDTNWWRQYGQALVALDGAAVLDGDAMLHADLRADNLMFCGERAVFVDWSWACIGNPAVDLAGWLPSLLMQGGRLPDDRVVACAPQIAVLAGYFLWCSLQPPLAHAPSLRAFQRDQAQALIPLVSAWLAAVPRS